MIPNTRTRIPITRPVRRIAARRDGFEMEPTVAPAGGVAVGSLELPVASIAEHRLVWCRLSRPTDYRRSCQRTAPFGTSRAGSPVTGSRHGSTVRDRAGYPRQAAVVALTGRGASAL